MSRYMTIKNYKVLNELFTTYIFFINLIEFIKSLIFLSDVSETKSK